MDIFNIKEM